MLVTEIQGGFGCSRKSGTLLTETHSGNSAVGSSILQCQQRSRFLNRPIFQQHSFTIQGESELKVLFFILLSSTENWTLLIVLGESNHNMTLPALHH